MISLLLYVGGLFSLIACDVLVTKFLSPETVALWAQVRSLAGIAAVLCLIGFDQVLVRSPQSSSRLLRVLAVQVPILAACVGAGILALGFLDRWWVAFGLAAGSAGSMVMFQYFRSHYHPAKSQLSQQGWKIGALIMVLLVIWQDMAWPLDQGVVVLLALSIAMGIIGVIIWPPSKMRTQNPEPILALYAIGARFMLTSLFLALAIYAEQLVVARLGTPTDAASYFTHATYFLFPVSVANGYVAFKIGPWIRDNHNPYVAYIQRKKLLIGSSVLLYAVILNFVGWIGWKVIAPQTGGPDFTLQLIFGASCVMRTLYVLPAGYIGVFGKPRQHDLMIAGQMVAAVLVISLFWVLNETFLGLLHAVALASALNWTLRMLVAAGTMQAILSAKQVMTK